MGDVIRIDSLDDPRVAPYRSMKDRELARQPGGRFIAEGEHVVRRLIASDFPTESLLVSELRSAEMSAVAPAGVPVYTVAKELLYEIVGFRFHQGVMACGRRKPSLRLEDLAPRWGDRPVTLVVCPDLNNTENLGLIVRIASGFGADAMLLGEESCDPFFRQTVRVSMGNVFRLPIVQSDDIRRDLRRLREEWGVELLATVLDESAEPLPSAGRKPRAAILFGNEAQGLPPDVVALCDRKVTIPMQLGTDSLNVAVAAGIFLYHFATRASGGGNLHAPRGLTSA